MNKILKSNSAIMFFFPVNVINWSAKLNRLFNIQTIIQPRTTIPEKNLKYSFEEYY